MNNNIITQPLRRDPTGVKVLAAAGKAWMSCGELRRRRRRYKRFTYGDQWSDTIETPDGEVMTEGAYARLRGKRPMSNNLIRKLVKCVVGRFRLSQADESIEGELSRLHQLNNLDELDSRTLEEFLISGCAIQRVVRERRQQGVDTWVEMVSPERFFINNIRDPRGWDTELVGMAHDMSRAELVMRFAHGDRRRAEALRNLYGSEAIAAVSTSTPLGSEAGEESFLRADAGRCRVIEAWTLEAAEWLACHDREQGLLMRRDLSAEPALEQENQRRLAQGRQPIEWRWESGTKWRCRWLAPDGTLLDSYDSPYSHGGHPFVVKLYPLTDGEVHSLVEDVIDQQVYVNRLITLIDHVISTSAKGALLFPTDRRIEGLNWSDIGRMWASPDAIIPYVGNADSPLPQQVSTNATDIGARELLALQMQMFEDVSGVSNALMGKADSAAVGATRYESQVRDAAVAINDLLLTFAHFRSQRDAKLLA